MTLSRTAALFWSLVAALVIMSAWPLRWWHPYCDTQADGPGYYAIGAPLPYSEPTGAVSLEHTILPLPLAFDVLVFAAALFALAALLMRHRAPPRRWLGLAAAWSGGLVFAALLAAIVFLIQSLDVTAWSFSSYDSYFSYRPFVLVAGHGAKPCSG
jgi:hypothetical protein